VPPNVLVTDWLPALEVNRMVDLAVIHGGQGTVQTACAAGKPFVGIGMQPEQEINIAVVERYGSAIRIQRNQLTPQRLQAAIRRLLADETARARKQRRWPRNSSSWDGAKNGAAYLIRQFGQGSPPAGYRPMQNLAGERVDARPYLIGGAAVALLAGSLWRQRRRR
jgi:UDP:flavonoid glycosyltransferase YjiC (YdhE family)